ncbi:MAG: amidohydrolase family protein [Kofleriaceae bacterium]
MSALLHVFVPLALGAGAASAETIAITNATVYSRADQKLEGATIVMRDGAIAAVGKGVAVPAGATTIDGTGKTVTAGLIEASTQIGLVEIDLEASGNDARFGVQHQEVYAAYRSRDAFDARSVAIPVARTGGVTSAITGPSGALVAGQAALVTMGAAPLTPLRAPIAMNAALGRGSNQLASRGHAVEKLRELFDDVDLYRKNKGAFDRNQARRLSAARLDLEALIPVLEGRLLLVVRADSEVDIRALLALAADRRLRIAIAGGAEAWQLAKELAAAKVPVILDPTANLPDDLAAIDARDDGPAILAKAGVTVAISTVGNASAARTLRQLAGIAVANGMTWPQALAAITQAPAQIYGVTDRGTLERGRVADVVVWSGDPLELSSRAETVIIGGVVQSLVTHQTRLRDRYRTMPAQTP